MKLTLAMSLSLVSIYASAQTRTAWTAGEQAFNKKVEYAIFHATPKNIEERVAEFNFGPTPAFIPGFDSLSPFPYRTEVVYIPADSVIEYDPQRPRFFSVEQKHIDITYSVNPKDTVTLKVSKDLAIFSLPKAPFCIRGNQSFPPSQTSKSYDGPFTAIFLGNFSRPDKKVLQKKATAWNITPLYSEQLDYLQIQAVYLLIKGTPEYADTIIQQIDFDLLNSLLTQ